MEVNLSIRIDIGILYKKELLMDIGVEIYNRVVRVLKSRYGAVEITAELIYDLGIFSEQVRTRFSEIRSLNIVDCNPRELRSVMAIRAVLYCLNRLQLLNMTDLECRCLSEEEMCEEMMQVWALQATIRESCRVISQ